MTADLACRVPLNAAKTQAHAVERTATPAEREAIARRLGVERVDDFSLRGSLTPAAGAVYEARGHVTLLAERVCVVTLEPFVEQTETDFEEFFTTRAESATVLDDDAPIDADMVEITLIDGTSIDFGEIALQYVAMALDPYPRGPDADTAEAEAPPAEDGARRPFADLARLLKRDGEGS